MHLEHPGLLYVAATLLPLASFVFLLLLGGVRQTLRARREVSPAAESCYRLLGGDVPGKGAAYVATGAIAGAFVLSAIGFAMYVSEHAGHEAHAAEEQHAEAESHDRWADRMNWAHVGLEPDDKYLPAAGSTLQLGYRIDSLAAVMFVMVTFIATLIHVFSIGYMGDELAETVEDHQVHTEEGHLKRRGRFGRFFLYLSLFCFSMLNLVLADNLFQVFLSWELVGVCSYLLVGYYFERQSASNAANKAFIVNRVGDAGFIIGLLILWTYVGSFNFEDVFKQVRGPAAYLQTAERERANQLVRADPIPESPGKLLVTPMGTGSEVVLFPLETGKEHQLPMTAQEIEVEAGTQGHRTMPYWLLVLAGLGIFLGCVGKSAQFPLHVWLPDAMEGPTPVSALIHAATMVAAGVYLVGRVYPLFTVESRLVIAYTGAITLFVAATVAMVMTDIKKVLAYSTVSQLGYMMLALGIGGWAAGLFHLVTHAFFKALLFLGSGSVIYGCHHEQDMRKMGGLYPKMTITALTMLAGVLAIAGTPLFSGWYSKDAIMGEALTFVMQAGHRKHGLLFALPLLTAGLTTFYMYRMWFMTFAGEPRDEHVHEHAHEAPALMTIPLLLLATFTICVGWGSPPWDPEASYLEGLIHHAQPASVSAEFGRTNDFAHLMGGLLALGLMVLGFVFAWVLYKSRRLDPADAKAQFAGVHRFLEHKWYFDEFYRALVVQPALVVGGWCRAFDTHVIDGVVNSMGWLAVFISRWDGLFDARIVDGLVNLTGRVVYAVGNRLRTVQTGYIRSYVLFLALAAVAIFLVLSYVFVTMAAPG